MWVIQCLQEIQGFFSGFTHRRNRKHKEIWPCYLAKINIYLFATWRSSVMEIFSIPEIDPLLSWYTLINKVTSFLSQRHLQGNTDDGLGLNLQIFSANITLLWQIFGTMGCLFVTYTSSWLYNAIHTQQWQIMFNPLKNPLNWH